MALVKNGFITRDELEKFDQIISEERYAKGTVAVVECIQEIPCNPCESICKQGAIVIGDPITNLPKLNEDKCNGCGVCVAMCPGLAIFTVNKTYSETEATVGFPYEYYPLPEVGADVKGVGRDGKVLCDAKVLKVLNPKSFDKTPVVTLVIPKEFADDVRSMKRL